VNTTSDQVRALLDLAGIQPSDFEIEALIASFPTTQAGIERLWAADLGDVAPATVFRAGEISGPKEHADA
jgi:hypothetical protein